MKWPVPKGLGVRLRAAVGSYFALWIALKFNIMSLSDKSQ